MAVYQFTTPTLKIMIPTRVSVGAFTSLAVTLKQGNRKLVKNLEEVDLDGENNAINVYLTQQETGIFSRGIVDVQCHILIGTEAYSTNEMKMEIKRNLHGEVIA